MLFPVAGWQYRSYVVSQMIQQQEQRAWYFIKYNVIVCTSWSQLGALDRSQTGLFVPGCQMTIQEVHGSLNDSAHVCNNLIMWINSPTTQHKKITSVYTPLKKISHYSSGGKCILNFNVSGWFKTNAHISNYFHHYRVKFAKQDKPLNTWDFVICNRGWSVRRFLHYNFFFISVEKLCSGNSMRWLGCKSWAEHSCLGTNTCI